MMPSTPPHPGVLFVCTWCKPGLSCWLFAGLPSARCHLTAEVTPKAIY